MLLSQVNKLLVINGACANNNYILTEVVGLVEVYDHITLNLINIVNISKDGLSHHVLPVNVIIHVLHESLHMIVVGCLKFLPDSVLFHLKVIVVVV